MFMYVLVFMFGMFKWMWCVIFCGNGMILIWIFDCLFLCLFLFLLWFFLLWLRRFCWMRFCVILIVWKLWRWILCRWMGMVVFWLGRCWFIGWIVCVLNIRVIRCWCWYFWVRWWCLMVRCVVGCSNICCWKCCCCWFLCWILILGRLRWLLVILSVRILLLLWCRIFSIWNMVIFRWCLLWIWCNCGNGWWWMKVVSVLWWFWVRWRLVCCFCCWNLLLLMKLFVVDRWVISRCLGLSVFSGGSLLVVFGKVWIGYLFCWLLLLVMVFGGVSCG